MVGSKSKIKRIREQKSRSRIRGTMRRNIKQTFSSEGIEIDPKKKEAIER